MARKEESARQKPVQALVEKGFKELPHDYIQPSCIVARDRDEDLNVPVIDIAGLASKDPLERSRTMADIHSACIEWGAFQVINHGVPKETLDGVKSAAKHFYDVPVEEKMEYFVTVFDGRPMRYSTSFDSATDVVLEWKDVLRIPAEPDTAAGVWPDEAHLPSAPVKRYSEVINGLVSKLLQVMSENLGLKSNYLNDALQGRERIMAMNFYPPCPNPEKVIGLGAHSDATAVTVLVQNDVQGLQVRNKGRWVTVKLLPDAILINLGDQIQILSNGRYQSVEHRAIVNEDKLRISIATLCGPSKASSIAPAPQLIDEEHPALYRPVVFKDYLLHYIKHGLNTRVALNSIAL